MISSELPVCMYVCMLCTAAAAAVLETFCCTELRCACTAAAVQQPQQITGRRLSNFCVWVIVSSTFSRLLIGRRSGRQIAYPAFTCLSNTICHAQHVRYIRIPVPRQPLSFSVGGTSMEIRAFSTLGNISKL